MKVKIIKVFSNLLNKSIKVKFHICKLIKNDKCFIWQENKNKWKLIKQINKTRTI